MRSCDAAKLLRYREPDDNDLRTAQRTLRLLWKEGLAKRLPYDELDYEHPSRSQVYGLSDRGVREYGGKTFDDHSLRTLDHELEITSFHIALKSLGEIRGWTLYWQQADLKTATIHPDAYFAITDPEKPEGRNTHHFFLEVERSKVSSYRDGESSIIRKLEKYYKLFDTPDCEKEWGVRQFRVVVVQRTDERRRNLCNALQEKYGHPMFWITTEALCRADIGSEIFVTPKACEAQSFGFSGII